MFGFICRSIGLDRSVRVRGVSNTFHRLCFMENLFCLRSISSSTDSNQHSFAVSYLVNSCGLSLKSALEASKRVHFETPHKPESSLSFFKGHGFSKDQILKLTKKYPEVLLLNVEKILSPKIKFFYSKGMPPLGVAKILTVYPWILRFSLKNHILPIFNFYDELFQCSDITIEVIRSCPLILSRHPMFVGSMFDILRDNGIPEKNIILLARRYSRMMVYMGTDPEKFKETVAKVREMGFDTSKTHFVVATMILTCVSRSKWEKRLDLYRKWGLSLEDIAAAFRKHPSFMALSEKKIKAVMEFFVNKLGWESSFLAQNPFLVSHSLEQRLIPRASVLQFLVSQGMMEKNFRSTTFFHVPENRFLQLFVNHNAESAKILELYQEKLTSQNKGD